MQEFNAGFAFSETTLQDWNKTVGVDLTEPFICSREAARRMQKQLPKEECIINISSVHQKISKPLYVPCSTSKAGIEMPTRTMALELAKDGIRANAVIPRAIATNVNLELKENKRSLKRF